MGKKYSGRRPENQPVYTEPTMLDFEKRRLFIPIMAGSPTPHPSLDPSRYNRDIYYLDYGLKWTDLGVITADAVYTLAYLSNGIVVLGNEGGHIWRSIDFGLTWTDLGAIASQDIFTFAYLGSGIVLMGDGAGHVFRSTNYGLKWTDLGDITSIDIFTIAYLGNGIVVLGDGSYHIWRSTDYGLNWSDLGAITDHNPNFILYLGSGVAVLGTEDSHVWRSTDYGANWTDLGAFAVRAIYSGVYIGNGIAILGDEDGHVWRSSDSGANWSDLGVIASISIWTIAYLGGGVVVLGDQAYHIYRSTDYGATWTDLGVIAAASLYAMTYLGNGIVLAGGNDDHIYRSTSAFHLWHEGVRQATDVEVSELSTATYDDVQDFINMSGDRTLLSGGAISAHGDADGSVVIAACTAWCKESDSDTAVGKFFDYAGKAKQTLTDLSVNAIYLDYNAGTPQIVVATDYGTYGFQQDHILLGAVYRQGTTVHIFPSSNLGIQGINRTFMHEVEHHGAHRSSGLVTSDGGSRALSITTGVLYAGLNRHTTTVNGSTWSYWYTSDSGSTWTEDTGISALVQSYNNIASGKVALGTNKYGVHWVYADIDGVHLHIVYGQGNYTANQAEEAGVPSVLPPIVTGYCVLIAKIINQEGSNTLTITYPWTTVFTSSLATDHNSLANLTTGNVHTQYVKHALATAASDFLVASGSGVYVKKTLAEAGAILEADLDHGNIQGLGDDDHTQYMKNLDEDTTPQLGDDLDAQGYKIHDQVHPYAAKTSAYTTTVDDEIIAVDTSFAPITITLGSAACRAGQIIIIKDYGGNSASLNITIATQGAETIDGSATDTIDKNRWSKLYYSNGTNWYSYALTDDHQAYGLLQLGTFANLPAPGTNGRLYYASDTKQLWRDNGAAWGKILYVNALWTPAIYTTQIPWVSLDGVTTSIPGGGSVAVGAIALLLQSGATTDNNTLCHTTYGFNDPWPTGEECTVEFPLSYRSGTANSRIIFLMTDSTLSPPDETDDHVGFIIDGGDLYSSSADGTTQETQDTGINIGTGNMLYQCKVVIDPGVSAKFYVNNVLKTTHTTRPPRADLAGGMVLSFGVETTANENQIAAWERVIVTKEL